VRVLPGGLYGCFRGLEWKWIADPNCDTVAKRDPNCDCDRDGNCDGQRDSYGYCDGDRHCDDYGYCNGDRYRDQYRDGHSNSYCDADADSYADPERFSDARLLQRVPVHHSSGHPRVRRRDCRDIVHAVPAGDE
jgi:hypothetical protein